jgi:hypothetical protein
MHPSCPSGADGEVDAKFRANAARVLRDDAIKEVSKLLWHLEDQSSLSGITDLLAARQ